MASAVALRFPLATASIAADAANRVPFGSVTEASHCLTEAHRAAASPGASITGGRVPAASLATVKQASAISRSPPSEARPA